MMSRFTTTKTTKTITNQVLRRVLWASGSERWSGPPPVAAPFPSAPTDFSFGRISFTSGLDHELGEARLAQVGLLDGAHQLRHLLDVRLEGHVAMLGELQEFYRRRAEVEMEYSRGMDKLVKQIMARHKTEKQR